MARIWRVLVKSPSEVPVETITWPRMAGSVSLTKVCHCEAVVLVYRGHHLEARQGAAMAKLPTVSMLAAMTGTPATGSGCA